VCPSVAACPNRSATPKQIDPQTYKHTQMQAKEENIIKRVPMRRLSDEESLSQKYTQLQHHEED